MYEIQRIPEIRALTDGAIRIAGHSMIESSGSFEGTYKATNGKVFEIWVEFGWYKKAFVWENEEDWSKHKRVIAHNINPALKFY